MIPEARLQEIERRANATSEENVQASKTRFWKPVAVDSANDVRELAAEVRRLREALQEIHDFEASLVANAYGQSKSFRLARAALTEERRKDAMSEEIWEIYPVYYVPRSQVWEGSGGRASGRIHLHVKGRALCGRKRGWYERPPGAGDERCSRCEASANKRGLDWPKSWDLSTV